MNWIWITALAAIVGGFLMRILRDQQRYRLMRVALERGDGTLPGGMPVWAVSFRQGVKLSSLGLALIAAGIFVWIATDVRAAHNRRPVAQHKVAGASGTGVKLAMPPPQPATRPHGPGFVPKRQSGHPMASHGHGRPPFFGGRRPGGPFGPGWHGPRGQYPPAPSARMIRVQMDANQILAAVTAIAVGIVFGILGLVRLRLARWERRTLAQQTPAHGDGEIL